MKVNPIIPILLFTLIFIHCKEEPKKVVDPTKATDSLRIHVDTNLTKQATLQKRIQPQAGNFKGFATLRNNVEALDGMTIAETKAGIEEWVDATLELQIALLDSLTNRAINARMSLLRTKTNLLKQEIEKRKIDTLVINKEATELYNAFQDLTIQLNREYGPSVDEYLKEFEKESQNLKKQALERRKSDTL